MGGPGSGRKIGCSQPCGTQAKYYYHWKRGESCDVCKAAVAAIAKAKYVKKPRKTRSSLKQSRRQWLVNQKMGRISCLDCGLKVKEDSTFVFDFDHRVPSLKTFTISQKLHHRSESELLIEMNKCDLVCANCHRLRTHKQVQAGIIDGYCSEVTQMRKDAMLTLF